MIQVDIPIAFGAGSLLAHASQRQLLYADKHNGPIAKALMLVIIFHTMFFLWPPLYLLVYYFGFETSHMWFHGDSIMSYPWLFPVVFLVLYLMKIFGFIAGSYCVRHGRPKYALVIYVAAVAFCLGWIFLMPDRTMTIGTYAQWKAGTAPWGNSDPAFMRFVYGLIISYTLGMIWVYRAIRKAGLAIQD